MITSSPGSVNGEWELTYEAINTEYTTWLRIPALAIANMF